MASVRRKPDGVSPIGQEPSGLQLTPPTVFDRLWTELEFRPEGAFVHPARANGPG